MVWGGWNRQSDTTIHALAFPLSQDFYDCRKPRRVSDAHLPIHRDGVVHRQRLAH